MGTSDSSKAKNAEATAELIRAHLAGPLPPDTVVIEALPAILGAMRKELLPEGGKPIGELLLDCDTSLEVIERIKDHGKRLARRNEPNHSVGTAIYYTAIASALVLHGKKVTKHPYAYLRDSFDAINRSWMTLEIQRHIAKALRICSKRAKD